MSTFLRVVVLGLFGLLPVALKTLSTGDCGIKPIKPIPPIGCKDLEAVCICDESGNKCKWHWVCVK